MHASNDSVGSVRPISDRKRLANQRNAGRSTGPRSDEGKRCSSMNAVSHGVFCRDLLLPGEDPEELARFRDGLLLDLRPAGMIQQGIAERIVASLWRLRRLGAAERTMHAQIEGCIGQVYRDKPVEERHAAAYAKLFSVESDRFKRLNAYEQSLMNMVHKGLKELRLLRKDAQEREADEGTAERAAESATPQAATNLPSDAGIENEPTETSTESNPVQPDATACNLTQPGATEGSKSENEPTEEATPAPSPLQGEGWGEGRSSRSEDA